MSRYLLSVHSIAGEMGDPTTDEDMQKKFKEIQAFHEEMKSSGAWVTTGALHGPDEAKVVDATGDEVVNTDGPFAETKEQIGGFYVIEASDLDAALKWATRASGLVGKPIEVRQFRDGTYE
jgi:hypothetical protein